MTKRRVTGNREDDNREKKRKTSNSTQENTILPPTSSRAVSIVNTKPQRKPQGTFLNRRAASGDTGPYTIMVHNDEEIDVSKMKMKDLLKMTRMGEPTEAASRKLAAGSRKSSKFEAVGEKEITEEERREEEMQKKKRGETIMNLQKPENSSYNEAPQVQVIDGKIVLKDDLISDSYDSVDAGVVYEHNSVTTNTSYRNKTPSDHWKALETEKFYKALSMFGTDFSLMTYYFPNRTRRNLRNKFKTEEKKHPVKIDTALKSRKSIDPSILETIES